MTISVIIPSRKRPQRLLEALARLYESVRTVGVEMEVIVVVERDALEESVPAQLPGFVRLHVRDSEPNAIQSFNAGAALATGDALVLGEDDVWFHVGWLEQALAALESIGGTGYVGLNGLSEHHVPTNYLVTRDWCIRFGGGVLSPPCYRSPPGDLEMWERAKRSGLYVWADGQHSEFNSICENMHFYHGKALWDETYALRKKQGEEGRDMEIFAARQAAGFPNDFERCIFPLVENGNG